MFRSPLDASSDSESDDNAETTDSLEEPGSAEVIERLTTNTESLPNGEYSDARSQDYELPQPSVNDHHANFLLAGLLENYSRVRAAEILNASTPGASYTRHSQEVRPLAEQLFSRSSNILDAHNVLPAPFASPEIQQNRSQYLNAIDSATLRTIQGSDMPDAQHFSNLLTADMVNMAVAPASPVSLTSPYQNTVMSTRPMLQLGRYYSDFQQLRLLGEGGYGRVFHVVNAVDQQHYAVKRIPLSARVYSRWLQGGDNSARTFREISTLAKLDHPNIVRYFGAWLEAPSTVLQQDVRSAAQGRSSSRKLLMDKPALTESPNQSKMPKVTIEQSDDIVFGEDTEPETVAGSKMDQSVQHLIAELPSKDQQTTSTHSLRDSEIFTDDQSRQVNPVETFGNDAPVLCIQMGLHAMTLSTYLSPLSSETTQPLTVPTSVRHCFHLVPSLRLLLGIICGLQYLHTIGIVHRDIKPSNILISESTQHAMGFYDVGSCHSCPERTPHFLNPRIADFGLVADIERSTRVELSSPYKAAGTELYRPPNPSIESANEKLDVFALGILFFELLWCFGTKTERAMVLSGLPRGEIPARLPARIDALCGDGIGAKVERCVRGMVDKDPEARWDLDTVKSWVDRLLEDLQSIAISHRDLS